MKPRSHYLTSNFVLFSIVAMGLMISPFVISTSSGFFLANTQSARVNLPIRSFPDPDIQAFGHYGQSVATSPGNLMVVGSANQTVDGLVGAGQVYTFNTKLGTLFSNLSSANPQAFGHFGRAVAISPACDGKPCRSIWVNSWCLLDACTLVVGAANETVDGIVGAGHAYIFNTNTSAVARTLASPNAQYEGQFGWSVTVGGSLVIVGAPNETVDGNVGAGRAYVFDALNGKVITTLTSPSPQTNGRFGESVGMSDNSRASTNLVIVGAPGQTVNGSLGAGQAYVFDPKTGVLISTLSSPNAQSNGWFGWSVSLTYNIVAAGAPKETSGAFSLAGNAYGFVATTGKLLYALKDPNPQRGGAFGWSVWLSAQTAGVGAPGEKVNGTADAGQAYTFGDQTGALISTYASLHPQADGSFGYSVTVVQNPGPHGYIIGIGAPDESTSGYIQSGNLYV